VQFARNTKWRFCERVKQNMWRGACVWERRCGACEWRVIARGSNWWIARRNGAPMD
jgi:hypothetical protein